MSSVVMYGAKWCAPCRATKPAFENLSDGYLSDMGVDFEYVDVDTVEPAVLQAENVRSVPTIILYRDDLPPVPVLSRTQAKMEQEIEQALIPVNSV
jgi:thiol-disulfide isomerase/thioredoxin